MSAVRIIAAVGVVVVMLGGLAGCGVAMAPMGGPTPAPSGLPEDAETPSGGPTVESNGELSEALARQVVQAYYDAMGDEDFEAMLGLTTGQAWDVTREFIEQVREVEQQYRVTAKLDVQDLALGEVERAGAAWVVHTEATITSSGQASFLSVSGPTYGVKTAFTVELVDRVPTITRLEQEMVQQ